MSNPEDTTTSTNPPEPASGSTPAAPAERFAARYEVVREIGRGGMGRVLLAEDTALGRRVALKTHLTGPTTDSRAVLRFLEEARATAQLGHPSIVSVYDAGESAEGQPYFTMPFVDGRSLAHVLAALVAGDAATAIAFGRAELLLAFLKICDAVAYAHDRGVLHRDLKPDNIMLGRFGEVFVMDWGLARVRAFDEPATTRSAERAISSVREPSGENLTLAGSIMGTPGYISPEQIRGDLAAIDARSDVFALGALLYEMLTMEPAIEGENVAMLLANTLVEPITPPRLRAPEKNVSEGLDAVVMKALAAAPEDRFQSVVTLREAVAAELEGSREAQRRRAAVEQRMRTAQEHLERHRAKFAQAESMAAALATRRKTIGADDLDGRRTLWREEAATDEMLAGARHAFWDAYGALVGAIAEDPDHEPAREALVNVLLDRARQARESGDREAATDLVAMARQHDGARVEAVLDASARMELSTSPPAASARVLRLHEEGPLLVERPFLKVAATPSTIELPPGRYVLELQSPGRPVVRASVSLESGERSALDVWIPRDGVVADGFVYIPGGAYDVGGDRNAPGFEPARRVVIAAFAIARYPVTMAEYAVFLNALAARDPVLAESHAPGIGSETRWRPDSSGEYRAPWKDIEGDTYESDAPVMMLGGASAQAYADWAAERTSTPLRLPSSDEWEIAARGGDDRPYPWGHRTDPALCWMRESFSGRKFWPQPVGRRPLDRSVFGVLELAGNVREATSTIRDDGARVVRGGAWQSPAEQCRIGRLTIAWPRETLHTLGFRLAVSIARTE